MVNAFFEKAVGVVWGYPLLIILIGSGLYFLIYLRFIPFRFLGHAIRILLGKYDNPDEPGHINHYQALSTAISATVGMGNVAGVAVAITMGGPGAIFWMWVSAFVGMATKYFTCTLAVMYRGADSDGQLQGGPMYYITEGLGKAWRPLGVFFAVACMIAMFPIFQANQLTQMIGDIILEPNGVETGVFTKAITGFIIALLMAVVVFGGVKRIGNLAGKMVPFMILLYFISVLIILVGNRTEVIPGFTLIFKDAFTGQSVMGGALGALIITGVKRAAFSNEAGMGTAPLAHGDAKTNEPVREGLVAMLGPFIDTIIVCTLTAMAIIVTGVWHASEENGITLTILAFEQGMPGVGPYILMLCVTIFSLTTLFAFPYYGSKCFVFLFGTRYKNSYLVLSILSTIIAAVATIDVVVNLVDTLYALMAIPTLTGALMLSPKVIAATKNYFKRMKNHL